MGKLKVTKWDAEMSIPVGKETDMDGLNMGDEVEMTVKGKVIGINLHEREKGDKTDTHGDVRIRASEVSIGDDKTEFELQTSRFDTDCDMC